MYPALRTSCFSWPISEAKKNALHCTYGKLLAPKERAHKIHGMRPRRITAHALLSSSNYVAAGLALLPICVAALAAAARTKTHLGRSIATALQLSPSLGQPALPPSLHQLLIHQVTVLQEQTKAMLLSALPTSQLCEFRLGGLKALLMVSTPHAALTDYYAANAKDQVNKCSRAICVDT